MEEKKATAILNFRKNPNVLSDFITEQGYHRVYVLVDKNTKKNCLPALLNFEFKNKFSNKYCVIEIPIGEKHKSLKTCELIWKKLEAENAARDSILLNLGGGIVCDMGGFCASVFKRGIDFVNIPTTLMAQADSAIGGKTGINFYGYKNHIGTFTQPKAIFINTEFLKTLPKQEILSGASEIVKHALIADEKLWNSLQDFKFSTLANDFVNSEKIIFKSIEIKNKIVADDFKEFGSRKLLNFGHTAGHAMESNFQSTTKKEILHGEAVAAGIIIETYLSVSENNFPVKHGEEIFRFVLKNFNPPLLKKTEIDSVIKLMSGDKKNVEGNINFTLLETIGKASINHYPAEKKIKEALLFYSSVTSS